MPNVDYTCELGTLIWNKTTRTHEEVTTRATCIWMLALVANVRLN